MVTGPPAKTVTDLPLASGRTSAMGTNVGLFSIKPMADSES